MVQQGGYFTAAQAVAAGIVDANHCHYLGRGEWARPMRGIYRLTDVPAGAHDDLHKFGLWLRGRDGSVQGVFGMETALSVYGLGDFMSAQIHVVIHSGFKRHAKPGGLVFHRIGLTGEAWAWVEGIPLQKPLAAIVAMLEAGGWPEINLRADECDRHQGRRRRLLL